MSNTIGQSRIKKLFTTMIVAKTVPRCMILEGPQGHGKRTIIKDLFLEYFDLSIRDSPKVDDIRDIIENALTLSKPHIYLIANAHDMTVQAQNAILKLAEEPPQFCHVIFTVTSVGALLPTIQSRAMVVTMDRYTKEELSFFTLDETILRIAENPGQIKMMEDTDFTELYCHCEKVVENVGKISAANAFNILKYVNPEEYNLFVLYLLYIYQEKIRDNRFYDIRVYYLNQLRVVYKFKQLLNYPSINKQNALEHMLLEIREASKNALPSTP